MLAARAAQAQSSLDTREFPSFRELWSASTSTFGLDTKDSALLGELLSSDDPAAAFQPELIEQSSRISALAEQLVRKGARRPREAETLWFARFVRLGIPSALLVIGLGALAFMHYRTTRAYETGLPWRVSSVFAEPGCTSPGQSCDEQRYFFCTNYQKEPWIEFDLGESVPVSELTITNRRDCCQDRAVPLVVEVSQDQKHWKEVAQKNDTFTQWRPSFKKTKARWIRLRSTKETYLHLSEVRIPH